MKQSSFLLILKILAGYFSTTALALLCLLFFSYPKSFLFPPGIENPVEFIKGMGGALLLGWILASYFLALPCAIFILITEIFSLRKRLLYMAFGAILGIAMLYYDWLHDSLFKVGGILISGAFCGLIYWKIAGRNAGIIRQRVCNKNGA